MIHRWYASLLQVQEDRHLQQAAGDSSTDNAAFAAQCLRIIGVPPGGAHAAVGEQRSCIVGACAKVGLSWLDTLVPLLLWSNKSVDPGYHGELWNGSLEALATRKQHLGPRHPVDSELAAFDASCEALCKDLVEGILSSLFNTPSLSLSVCPQLCLPSTNKGSC